MPEKHFLIGRGVVQKASIYWESLILQLRKAFTQQKTLKILRKVPVRCKYFKYLTHFDDKLGSDPTTDEDTSNDPF
jgi:hypothetical protein